MAQLVLAVGGAIVGGFVGGPVGAQVGWALGSAVGASFAPNKKVQGQQIGDLRVIAAEYGRVIPWVQSHPAVPGDFWWNSDRRPIATTTTEGGKGGGGGVETTTYTYEMDCRLGLTANEIAGVTRIWFDGKLVWTRRADADAASLAASEASDLWTRMTVYTGAEDQEVDPTEEAAVGAAAAIAYRGRGSIFFEGLQLGSSGRVPNIIAEVATKLVPDTPASVLLVTFAQLSSGAVGAIAFSADGWIAHRQIGSTADFDVLQYAPGTGLYTDIGTITGPGSSATGSRGNTDRSCFIFHANPPATLTMFTESSATGVVFSLPEYHVSVCFARKDGYFVCASRQQTGSKVIYRFSTSGGLPVVTSAALGEYVHALAIVGTDVYALQEDNSHVYRLDLATLTLQETIASPTGAAAGDWIFSGETTNLWYGVAATDKIFERVNDAWVERGDSALNLFSINSVGAAVADNAVYAATADATTHSTFRMSPLDSGTPDEESLADVVERLCLRAGLTASQFDVTGLAAITREVRALAVSQVAPARSTLELLQSTFFFEMTVADKIYFRPRGGSAAATLAYAELGARRGGGEWPEPLSLSIANDLELPAQIALSYINVSDDYQTDTQYSDRLVSSTSGAVLEVRLPIGLTPSEAKQIADAMLLDMKVASVSTKLSLLGEHAALEPTDVVVATGSDGSTYRLRLVKKTDAYPLLEFDAVLDDVSILTSQGITSADYSITTTVAAAVDTVLELLDVPILRDADDDSGFYAAAKGDGTPWPGAALLKSADDVEYDEAERFTESAVIGEATTRLGDWTGGFVFDERNSVTVNVGSGTLASTTRAAMLLDRSVNAAAIGADGLGWEVIQFRTATLVSAGIYTLTGLLRGMRGTEWMSSGRHYAPSGSPPSAGERFVLLRTSGLRRVPMDAAELGVDRYWKGVTLGRRLSTATAETFSNDGVGLKPYAPVDLRAARADGDLVLTWKRRTRLTDRFGGALGDSVPLGEDSESYSIDIIAPGSPDTVLRTISASSQTATYTAAQQTVDFGSPQPDSVRVRVYQVSAQVSRGYALEETL